MLTTRADGTITIDVKDDGTCSIGMSHLADNRNVQVSKAWY